jgi:hypothetical protein
VPRTAGFTGRFGRATLNGVEMSLTKFSSKPRKEFADGTDSNNYDSVTGQLWTSQYPGATGFDGSLEGFVDTGGIFDTAFIQALKTDGPFPLIKYYNRTLVYFNWLCDFTDVEVNLVVPGATMVTFSANYKTNGPPTSLP